MEADRKDLVGSEDAGTGLQGNRPLQSRQAWGVCVLGGIPACPTVLCYPEKPCQYACYCSFGCLSFWSSPLKRNHLENLRETLWKGHMGGKLGGTGLEASSLGDRDSTQTSGKGQRNRVGQSACGTKSGAQNHLGVAERGRAHEWGLAREGTRRHTWSRRKVNLVL